LAIGGLAALGAPALVAFAQAGAAPVAPTPEPAQSPEEIARQGAAVATQMNAAIAGRPVTTSAADYEGILVFAASQSNATDDVILDALNRLTPGDNANLREAIENVRKAILAKRLRRGTAAINNGYGAGSGSGFGGSFTSPNINTGGGSSNYGQ
jgi:uncharacterized membrane protein YgcG